jgi:hypothetical protein
MLFSCTILNELHHFFTKIFKYFSTYQEFWWLYLVKPRRASVASSMGKPSAVCWCTINTNPLCHIILCEVRAVTGVDHQLGLGNKQPG